MPIEGSFFVVQRKMHSLQHDFQINIYAGDRVREVAIFFWLIRTVYLVLFNYIIPFKYILLPYSLTVSRKKERQRESRNDKKFSAPTI